MVHRDQGISVNSNHLPTKLVFYIAQRTINEHFDILVMHGSVVVVCLVLSSELMLQLELSDRDCTHDSRN